MTKKIVNLCLLIATGLTLMFIDFNFPSPYWEKASITAFASALCYLLLKIVLDETVMRKVKSSKTRYSLRKITSTIFLIALTIVLLRVWLPNAQALLLSYGLVAAGVAIALQDFFKNIAGGIIIFISGTCNVGDRIEVDGKFGDIIDIDIFYTTLLETREWVDGDQSTGRIVKVPNGYALSQNVNHYTKDHEFIWDEIPLHITYESDWEKAMHVIKHIVTTQTSQITQKAEEEFSALEKRYYVSSRNIEPDVFMTMTDNDILLSVRYITHVRERRILHNKLSQLILKEVQKHPDIEISSINIDIEVHKNVSK